MNREPIPAQMNRRTLLPARSLLMCTMQIRLFGAFDVRRGTEPFGPFPTSKSRSLFAFLVLHQEHAHARNFLAGTFWGDRTDAAARKCLRTELWRIRRAIGGNELSALHADNVRFTNTDGWVDVFEFERRAAPLQSRTALELRPDDVKALQEAVALYRGHLLEGMYDDWCLYLRERLRLMHSNALLQLLSYSMDEADWPAALQYGERLLSSDPLLEHVHRSLMKCHYYMGNRASALRQYTLCERVLRDELDVDPMRATVVLAERIRSGARRTGNIPKRITSRSNQHTEHLEAADRHITRAHQQIRRELRVARSRHHE